MTSPVTSPPLSRADAPYEAVASRGFFPFADPGARALSLHFWILQVYLLLSVTMVDEHFPAILALKPRTMLGLLALVIALVRGLQDNRAAGLGLTVRHKQSGWLIAFVICCSFSALWAFDFGEAIGPHIDHLTAMMIYLLLVGIVQTRRELLVTIVTLCAGVGIYILLSLWEWFGGRYDFTMGVMRMEGAGQSYRDANSFGATIVFALPLVIWAGVHTRSFLLRAGAALYGALTVYCVVKTSSRSALVLLVLTAIWTLFFLPRRWQRIAGVAALVAAGVALAAGLSPNQKKRVLSLFSSQTYEKEGSTVGRIDAYAVAWRIFKDRPALGVGPGNWQPYRVRKVDGSKLEPHSLGGSLIATRGALGTFTFLAFIIASIAFGLREMRRRKLAGTPWDDAVRRLCFAMIFVFFLLFVAGLGAHNLARPNWYLAPALMLLAATCRKGPGEPSTEAAS